MNAQDFVSMFKAKEQENPIKFGRVAANHVSGRPSILFDGETLASTKKYPHLSSYTPVANDRVMIVKGVVIGKII